MSIPGAITRSFDQKTKTTTYVFSNFPATGGGGHQLMMLLGKKAYGQRWTPGLELLKDERGNYVVANITAKGEKFFVPMTDAHKAAWTGQTVTLASGETSNALAVINGIVKDVNAFSSSKPPTPAYKPPPEYLTGW